MANHTLSPWAVCEYELGLKAVKAPQVSDFELVAVSIEAADAYLIAAAPELLGSLEKMLAVYWEDGDGANPPQLILDAQTAIRRAKGAA